MNINELVGKTLTEVKRIDDEEICFIISPDEQYRMFHMQDCCESVGIDDICGELSDLVGSPILQAEESSRNENPEGFKALRYQYSFTWTFYRIATIKGQVVIRWYGESNGYYSESVDFQRISR